MNKDSIAPKWEDRFDDDVRDIANVEAFEFVMLLMECRIIVVSGWQIAASARGAASQ